MSGHVQFFLPEAMPSFHKYGYGGGVFGFSILFSSIKTLADEEELFFWREREQGGGSPGIFSLGNALSLRAGFLLSVRFSRYLVTIA